MSSLSSHEVALGYRENTPDPSVFIQFEALSGTDGAPPPVPTYFLAWTTTPWTLPGNTALAVAPDAEYSIVATANNRGDTVRLVLATALLNALHGDYTTVATMPGRALVGIPYRPLYDAAEFGVPIRQFVRRPGPGDSAIVELEDTDSYAPAVVAADFVSMDDGTGIVHIAPAFGDEDLALGREQELAFIQQVDLQGIITGDYPFAGKFVKDADPEIAADLADRGLLYTGLPTATPTPSVGAATRPCCTTPRPAGTSAPPPAKTGWWASTAASTGIPNTSAKGASANGSATMWTGPSAGSATGARPSPSGAATAATLWNASAAWPSWARVPARMSAILTCTAPMWTK